MYKSSYSNFVCGIWTSLPTTVLYPNPTPSTPSVAYVIVMLGTLADVDKISTC